MLVRKLLTAVRWSDAVRMFSETRLRFSVSAELAGDVTTDPPRYLGKPGP